MKLLTQTVLALLFFLTFAVIYTWQLALLILITVSIHELGHLYAMKRCGIHTKGFFLIPFLGGIAVGEGAAQTRNDEVYIALNGPVWGLYVGIVCLAIGYLTRDPLWFAAAQIVAVIHLFNMLPLFPLDGGQVLQAFAESISPRFASNVRIVTLGALILIGIVFTNGLALLLAYGCWCYHDQERPWLVPMKGFDYVRNSFYTLGVLAATIIILVLSSSDPRTKQACAYLQGN